jgi:hypothetical protein
MNWLENIYYLIKNQILLLNILSTNFLNQYGGVDDVIDEYDYLYNIKSKTILDQYNGLNNV